MSSIALKLRTTPKWRLFLQQCGPYEVGISIDLRDAWTGLYWRRERYVRHDQVLQRIYEIAYSASRREIRDTARQALEATVWMQLNEIYLCPIPFLVFSLKFP